MRLPITALRGALLGLLLAGLHACSQQTDELPTPARSESAFSAADAQSWYQGVIASPSTDRQQAGVASARALPPPSNPAPQLLQWGRTRTVGQGADQLLLVPLGNDAALFAHSTYVGTRYLIVTRNPSGALDGNILELLLRRTAAPVDTTALFASLYRNYHSGQWAAPVSGAGLVLLYSANYQYLTGRRFRAGHFLPGTARLAFQLHSSTTTNAANRGVVANGGVATNGGMTTNFTEMPDEEGACIDWYDGRTGEYITSTGNCGGGGGGSGGTGGGSYEPPYTGPGTNGPGGYDPNPNSGGGGVNNPGSSSVAGDTPELRLFEEDYRTKMSPSELMIFDSMTRVQQVSYLLNAQMATSRAEAEYPGPGLHNGNGDAFRHSLFSALNTIDLGAVLTKSLGDAHENRPNLTPLEQLEVTMDLYNNQQGRNIIGTTNFPEGAIIRLLNAGGLRIIKNGIMIPSHP